MNQMQKKLIVLGITGIVALIFVPQITTETTYFTSYLANTIFRNNLHEVVPNRFYRAAEMSREDLANTIVDRKIRTVIDLRLNEDAPDATGTTEEQTTLESGAVYSHLVPVASGASSFSLRSMTVRILRSTIVFARSSRDISAAR